MEKYDLIIIGAGAAGLTAAIYACRANISTALIERSAPGGQITITDMVENYPGIDSISGFELAQKMYSQASKFGAVIKSAQIENVNLFNKTVQTAKSNMQAKAIIIATGASPKKAGFIGEDEYTGKGVSYCATCDGFFFKDKQVFVIGSGNSAVQEAIFLTQFVRDVTLLVRKDKLKCSKRLEDKLSANSNITVMYNTQLVKVAGNGKIESVVIKNNQTQEETTLYADSNFGVFVFAGYEPKTEMFKGLEKDEQGNIITDENMHTNIEGVFAAGDVRKKVLRQIVTAAADGALAAYEAEKYLEL